MALVQRTITVGKNYFGPLCKFTFGRIWRKIPLTFKLIWPVNRASKQCFTSLIAGLDDFTLRRSFAIPTSLEKDKNLFGIISLVYIKGWRSAIQTFCIRISSMHNFLIEWRGGNSEGKNDSREDCPNKQLYHAHLNYQIHTLFWLQIMTISLFSNISHKRQSRKITKMLLKFFMIEEKS